MVLIYHITITAGIQHVYCYFDETTRWSIHCIIILYTYANRILVTIFGKHNLIHTCKVVTDECRPPHPRSYVAHILRKQLSPRGRWVGEPVPIGRHVCGGGSPTARKRGRWWWWHVTLGLAGAHFGPGDVGVAHFGSSDVRVAHFGADDNCGH